MRSEGIIVSENEVVVVVRKHRRDALCVVIWTHRTSVALTGRVPPVHAEPSLNSKRLRRLAMNPPQAHITRLVPKNAGMQTPKRDVYHERRG